MTSDRHAGVHLGPWLTVLVVLALFVLVKLVLPIVANLFFGLGVELPTVPELALTLFAALLAGLILLHLRQRRSR